MEILLKNVDLYLPEHIGIRDVLIDENGIININETINVHCKKIDCKGNILCPSFVDGHEHLLSNLLQKA